MPALPPRIHSRKPAAHPTLGHILVPPARVLSADAKSGLPRALGPVALLAVPRYGRIRRGFAFSSPLGSSCLLKLRSPESVYGGRRAAEAFPAHPAPRFPPAKHSRRDRQGCKSHSRLRPVPPCDHGA